MVCTVLGHWLTRQGDDEYARLRERARHMLQERNHHTTAQEHQPLRVAESASVSTLPESNGRGLRQPQSNLDSDWCYLKN